jgi:hypothetical protein
MAAGGGGRPARLEGEEAMTTSPRQTGTCVTCNASFSYLPSQVSGRFCSKRCAGATKSAQVRKQRSMIGGSLISVQDIMTKYGVCRRTVVLEAAFGLSCVVLRGCMGRTVLPLCPSGLVGYEPQVRRRCNGSGGAIMSHWHPDLPFCALILFLIFLMFLPEMIEGVRKYRAGRDLAQRITAEHEAIKALEKRAR